MREARGVEVAQQAVDEAEAPVVVRVDPGEAAGQQVDHVSHVDVGRHAGNAVLHLRGRQGSAAQRVIADQRLTTGRADCVIEGVRPLQQARKFQATHDHKIQQTHTECLILPHLGVDEKRDFVVDAVGPGELEHRVDVHRRLGQQRRNQADLVKPVVALQVEREAKEAGGRERGCGVTSMDTAQE